MVADPATTAGPLPSMLGRPYQTTTRLQRLYDIRSSPPACAWSQARFFIRSFGMKVFITGVPRNSGGLCGMHAMTLQPRMVCTECDQRGADVSPSWLHHG